MQAVQLAEVAPRVEKLPSLHAVGWSLPPAQPIPGGQRAHEPLVIAQPPELAPRLA